MESVRLAPGDKVSLIVYGEDTLTREYMVDEDGNVNVPLIGSVAARGLTKTELQKEIGQRLMRGGFQQDPFVTVDSPGLRPIYILGEVNSPGSYAYMPHLTVFQAVALGGGYTPRASKSRIAVTRFRDGQQIKFRAKQDSPLLPGDSIMVYQRLF